MSCYTYLFILGEIRKGKKRYRKKIWGKSTQFNHVAHAYVFWRSDGGMRVQTQVNWGDFWAMERRLVG